MSTQNALSALSTFFVDLVFPPRCAVCARIDHHLCDVCVRAFTPLDQTRACPRCAQPDTAGAICERCAVEPPPFDGVYSAFRYEGGLRAVVYALKYLRHTTVLDPLLTAMHTHIDWARLPSEAVCCPVPLSTARLNERGFNQALLLAQGIAAKVGYTLLVEQALRRIVDTQTQVDLNYTQRQKNLHGAFVAEPAYVADKTIILVDDVCTTGATLRLCTQALLYAGARRVIGLTLARTP